MTTDGQLYYFELVSAMDAAIANRVIHSTKTLQANILPKVLVADTRNPVFDPNGQRLAYVAGGSRDPHINITDLEGKIQQEIRFERQVRPRGPMFSPDGKQLGVSLYEAGELRLGLVSLETGSLLKLLSPLGQEPGGYFNFIGWSLDGQTLYVLLKPETGEKALVAIDVETEQVVESSVLSPDVLLAHLSPSKEYLALWSRSSGRLMLRSLEDGTERQLKATQVGPFVAWDFDSRHLFYQKYEDSRGLYSFSIDTEEERLLVEDMEDLALSSVGPDGNHLGLTRNGVWDERVWVLENFLPENPESTDQSASR